MNETQATILFGSIIVLIGLFGWILYLLNDIRAKAITIIDKTGSKDKSSEGP